MFHYESDEGEPTLGSILRGDCWVDFGERWLAAFGVGLPHHVATARIEQEKHERKAEQTRREAEAADRISRTLTDDPEQATHWPLPSGDKVIDSVKLFSKEQIEAGATRFLNSQSDKDNRDSVRAILAVLQHRGEFRLLARPQKSWRAELDRLSEAFPNFEEVVDFVRGHFALGELKRSAPAIPPLLLNGPPGVGKTFFAEQLSGLLQTVCIRVGFDTAQNNSALCGSSTFWSNSQPGHIFEALVYGDMANPVVLIDEIDKSTPISYDPVNALLNLLEPLSAARFSDLAFPWITVDARYITWICCSNDADLLPGPVLSRLVRFEVPSPSAAQARGLVQSMFLKMRRDLPDEAQAMELSESTIEVLSKRPPRAIRQALHNAIAAVIFRSGLVIDEEDLRHDGEPRQMGIGFVISASVVR